MIFAISRIMFFVLLCLCSVKAQNVYQDNIDMAKVTKLVKKEEIIARAYEEYIIVNGVKPTLDDLLQGGFLPDGFSKIGAFGRELKISSTSHAIEVGLPNIMKEKMPIYGYYYAFENRKYTKPPTSKNSTHLEIILSSHAKYVYEFKDYITKNFIDKNNKYYLDSSGVLHWYDNSGNWIYSLDSKLIANDVLGSDGSIDSDVLDILDANKVLYAGLEIYNISDGVAQKYVNIGDEHGFVKLGGTQRDIGKTIIQFTRRAGGMIVNGDIYTWGNNANKITGININSYTGAGSSNRYPVVNALIKARAKTYNTSFDNISYFSSPLRPRFVDFFATVYHGTCGVTTDGIVYCGGGTGVDQSALFRNTDRPNGGAEMLYKSTFFNGTDGRKATKIMANNQIWLMLANTNIDIDGTYKNGEIWRWGEDFAGFAGVSSANTWKYANTGNPTELVITSGGTKVLFKDLTYLLTIGYRKMGALSNEGDIWMWGLDTYYPNGCSQTISGQNVNLCIPSKVTSSVSFISIKGGLQGFIAQGIDGNFYKVYQKWGELPSVESLNQMIQNYSYSSDNQYVAEDDNEILDVDLSSRLQGTSLIQNEGIVWVNGKNELKGDYFISSNVSDDLFKAAIKRIKWKKIKVLDDDNGMCGIDIYNQMYCWGIVSYNRTGSTVTDDTGNTYMLPVFNTNLYDLDKDFLVAEGGRNGHLTPMSSGEWTTGGGNFFLKYPTYIGGFNYEFIFK